MYTKLNTTGIRKKSSPVKKAPLLEKVDPDTGKIIPTRGRAKKENEGICL